MTPLSQVCLAVFLLGFVGWWVSFHWPICKGWGKWVIEWLDKGANG